MEEGSLPAAADFRADTEVEPAGDGRYRCTLADRWNAAIHPFGGVVLAIALRAAERELGDPSQPLRTAAALFVSPVTEGPLEVQTRRLRIGRTGSQLLVHARSNGSAEGGLTLLAAYGREREGFAFTDLEPPEAPRPSAARLRRIRLPTTGAGARASSTRSRRATCACTRRGSRAGKGGARRPCAGCASGARRGSRTGRSTRSRS